MNKFTTLAIITFFLSSATIASAHVVVHPQEVGIGSYQIFSVGVPSEKAIPTVELRLLIPSGLQFVTPNAKPGWTVSVKRDGTTDGAAVTEIDWVGGSIPSGERDDFIFNAKVPATETQLAWKAYQVYSDGSVVSWDQDPATTSAAAEENPYSLTQVINDLKATTTAATPPSTTNTAAFIISVAAFIVSIIALAHANKHS